MKSGKRPGLIVDGYEASNSRDQDSDSGESSYEEVEVEVEVDATVDETLGRSAMIGDSFKNSLNGGDNRSQMTPDNGDRLLSNDGGSDYMDNNADLTSNGQKAAMNLSQVNNILAKDRAADKNKKVKVKKIIRRKKVKVTKRPSKNGLKPGWDNDNKVVGTEGDDYNYRGNRKNAKHIDLSGSAASPTIPVKSSKLN